MDQGSGALTQLQQVETEELLFMDFAEGQNGVLAAHRGKVTSYNLQLPTGEITPGPSGTTLGLGVGLADDQTGRYVIVSNFFDDAVSFLPFTGDAFGEAEEFQCVDPHAVGVHRNNRWVYIPCLSGSVLQFTLDVNAGTMTPMAAGPVAQDSGPRHLEFHPTLDVVYIFLEHGGAIVVFDTNPNTGELVTPPRQTVPTSMLGDDSRSSDIRITPNGKWLYGFHRGNEALALLSVEANGQIAFVREIEIGRGAVRKFDVDARGKFLVMGSQSGDLSTWEIDDQTGDIVLRSSLEGLGDLQWVGIRYYE